MNKKVNKKEFLEKLTVCRQDYDSEKFKQDKQDLDTLLQQAKEQEREKCAKIAEGYQTGDMDSEATIIATLIAKAIRNSKD